MTPYEFEKFVKKFLGEVESTLCQANTEYTNGGDPEFKDSCFANFETTAKEEGLTREQVNRVFRGKHAQCIQGWINGIEQKREPIRTRFVDMLAYDVIHAAMLLDNGDVTS